MDGEYVNMKLSHAYAFRVALEYIKKSCTEVNFLFSENGLRIEQQDSGGTITIIMDVRGDDILNYKYTYDKDIYIFGIDLQKLIPMIKGIGKKDGMQISCLNDKRMAISIGHNATQSTDNCAIITHINVNRPELRYSKYGNVICRISNTNFSTVCNCIGTSKCNFVEIVGYDGAIVMKSYKTGDSPVRVDQFGDDSQIDGGEDEEEGEGIKFESKYPSVKVSSSIIKTMSCFKSLSQSGVIKCYMKNKKPLKLNTSIESWGSLTIFLRNSHKKK